MYRRSWSSLPTTFASAQRLSERNVEIFNRDGQRNQLIITNDQSPKGPIIQIKSMRFQTETISSEPYRILRQTFQNKFLAAANKGARQF
jgi:hypothetical protein